MEANSTVEKCFVSIDEASVYLNLHKMTVYRLAKRKLIPMIKVGGKWKTKIEWLDKFFENKMEKAT